MRLQVLCCCRRWTRSGGLSYTHENQNHPPRAHWYRSLLAVAGSGTAAVAALLLALSLLRRRLPLRLFQLLAVGIRPDLRRRLFLRQLLAGLWLSQHLRRLHLWLVLLWFPRLFPRRLLARLWPRFRPLRLLPEAWCPLQGLRQRRLEKTLWKRLVPEPACSACYLLYIIALPA